MIDLIRLKEIFWELYLQSNSPSKWLLNQNGNGKHHKILELWNGFLSQQDKVEMMFWSNDNLRVAPTHYFSKLYENDLKGSTTFEHRCIGYLCSFIFQSRSLLLTGKNCKLGTRVSSLVFDVKNGQVYE